MVTNSVITREQNEDRQLIALHEMAVPDKNIFMDRQSGKDLNRLRYKKLEKRRDHLYCRRKCLRATAVRLS